MTQLVDKISKEQEEVSGKYLTFQLGEEHYGLPILQVREIIGLMDITKVPRSPDYIRGVINLRGRIIPVLNLRDRFGMTSVEDTSMTCIIVVDVEAQGATTLMGILVDSVREVLDIIPEDIEPAPSFGAGANGNAIRAMAKGKERVTILLSTEQVVNSESLAATSESGEEEKKN
ncbi:MAG: chemotaxis protein CheW [Planctomycetota bacterium]